MQQQNFSTVGANTLLYNSMISEKKGHIRIKFQVFIAKE